MRSYTSWGGNWVSDKTSWVKSCCAHRKMDRWQTFLWGGVGKENEKKVVSSRKAGLEVDAKKVYSQVRHPIKGGVKSLKVILAGRGKGIQDRIK